MPSSNISFTSVKLEDNVDDVVNGTAMRKRGRPPGSKNKPYEGPPRKRKGRSHDDDWNQGHHSLQPNVKMVCLAGINKNVALCVNAEGPAQLLKGLIANRTLRTHLRKD